MAQSTIAFSIKSFCPAGFSLATFQAAIEAAGIGVALLSCEQGQFTTQNEDDPEAILVFAGPLMPAALNAIYAAVAAYVPPLPAPPSAPEGLSPELAALLFLPAP